MAATRIYAVTDTENEDVALVRASTQAQAIRHVVKHRFDVAVADQEQLVDLLSRGYLVKDATGEDEPEVNPNQLPIPEVTA